MNSKNIFLPIVILALFAMSGCKKILDQKILGSYEASQFFTSYANAAVAVNTAYNPLLFTDAGSNAIWVLGDVATDDAVKGGNPGDQADFLRIDEYNINPSNSAVEGVWRRYYDGIFKCNVVIDGLPETNTAVSADVRKTVVGQAKFLRAYYYFLLTNFYGKIPLHLKVETGEESQSSALEQTAIYAQIETDCIDAADALPALWSNTTDQGRATKGAALALLAKAYLFQGKWDMASQTAKQIEASGVYNLLPKFTDNFNQATKINNEAIFSVWQETGASPFLGNNLNQWFAPRTINGYGFFYPTQSLVDNFEKSSASDTSDPRLDYSVARIGHPYFDVDFDPTWTNTGYLSKKQIQPLSEIPTNIKGDGNLNYEAIRFADILLVEAEALNEMGSSSEALIPLNKVRKRARESYLNDQSLPGFGQIPTGLLPDITVTDQATLRDLIRKERRSELALEFQRFFDIMRYGEAYVTNALKDVPNFNYANNRFFSIPQSERDTNKKL